MRHTAKKCDQYSDAGECRYDVEGYCGYSQQVVDALTKERDELKAERNKYIQVMMDAAFESIASIKSELQIELEKIQFNYDLMDDETNREQVAGFYKTWIDKIDATPKLGRSLTLYQDFSSAFVLGKQLPTLPPSGNYARRPEKVAELFMLNCL